MIQDEDENIEDAFPIAEKRERFTKEQVLDEAYKKVEISKKFNILEVKKEPIKKPLYLLGIIIVVFSIISIIIIFNVPWLFVKYDTTNYETNYSVQEFLLNDFKTETTYPEIEFIFETNCINCSNNSKNFLGLEIDDFSTTPTQSFYSFIALTILGVVFTIFLLIDRKKNYSINFVRIIHSITAIISFSISFFILFILFKFIGAFFLLFYNNPFITQIGIENLSLFYVAPLLLAVICLIIMKISTSVIKINFKELMEKYEEDKKRKTYSTFRYGSSL